MANIIDYVAWRGDLPFSISPFNDVDALILAELSYIDYADVVPEDMRKTITLSEAAKRYFEMRPYREGALGVLVPDVLQDLLLKAGDSRRFGDIGLSGYVNKIDEDIEEQFSAVTFTVDDKRRYVALRGTDDTIVGWKENFNMSYMFPVPAQTDAAMYLEKAAAAKEGDIIVGGHSKGGNLAVYAAEYCGEDTQKRIISVYNFDGPGFPTQQTANANYIAVRERVTTILPKSSLVGILLEHEKNFRIVTSTASGKGQHDATTWQVTRDGFIYTNGLDRRSLRNDESLHSWISSMNIEERRVMVEKMFALRNNVDATTLTELSRDITKILPKFLKTFDKDTRQVLMKAIKALIKERQAVVVRDAKDAINTKVLRHGDETHEEK